MSEVTSNNVEHAILAGGCFWCLEAVFRDLQGVSKVESGYAGGHVANPSYDAVCSGSTGHAEVVDIAFDPQAISYADLLRVFFTIHDPTTLNRQGNDVGTQYRSAIFAQSPAQHATAEAVMREVPKGALALSALTVGLLVVAWFVLYLFVFLPRGSAG